MWWCVDVGADREPQALILAVFGPAVRRLFAGEESRVLAERGCDRSPEKHAAAGCLGLRRVQTSARLALRVGADCGDIGGDPDFVAHDDASRLERLLPAEPELAAVDRSAYLKSDTIVALRLA